MASILDYGAGSQVRDAQSPSREAEASRNCSIHLSKPYFIRFLAMVWSCMLLVPS